MKTLLFFLLFAITLGSCHSQTSKQIKVVGGPCEGCEAIHEYGDRLLTPVDTLPNFSFTEPKIRLTGTVYHQDGKTPAEGIILYIYHTNREGIYETKGDEKGWARRHGYIRGWVKTGMDGKYTFYTFRPAAYPSGTEPEHIHLTVKEPGKSEYYLDDFLFEDDPMLSSEIKKNRPNRGGSGIQMPRENMGILEIKRDLILGLNIPEY
ncbi:MAG: intradiol ring-cleavage dioxygenase [Cyclobacteriaceae bacterium]|nr:intradiol ring-cleavage dioxygenase [Cyclobacteriaceae bacterium]MDX5466460.1 intradiol ring-cleavage dioxygenase [Cyclobacteriaceae bacterium]